MDNGEVFKITATKGETLPELYFTTNLVLGNMIKIEVFVRIVL